MVEMTEIPPSRSRRCAVARQDGGPVRLLASAATVGRAAARTAAAARRDSICLLPPTRHAKGPLRLLRRWRAGFWGTKRCSCTRFGCGKGFLEGDRRSALRFDFRLLSFKPSAWRNQAPRGRNTPKHGKTRQNTVKKHRDGGK